MQVQRLHPEMSLRLSVELGIGNKAEPALPMSLMGVQSSLLQSALYQETAAPVAASPSADGAACPQLMMSLPWEVRHETRSHRGSGLQLQARESLCWSQAVLRGCVSFGRYQATAPSSAVLTSQPSAQTAGFGPDCSELVQDSQEP
jgi:hypothetical protein